jgi:hypothetical protein
VNECTLSCHSINHGLHCLPRFIDQHSTDVLYIFLEAIRTHVYRCNRVDIFIHRMHALYAHVMKKVLHTSNISLMLSITCRGIGGTISVTPASGTAMTTLFTIEAKNWEEADALPITYQFEYFTPEDSSVSTVHMHSRACVTITCWLLRVLLSHAQV